MQRMSYLIAGVAISVFAAGIALAADEKVQGDLYPLSTCPVSGEALGSMGDPVVKVYDGREVRFCCGGCVKKYEENAAKFNEEIDAAIKKQQAAAYPITTCIISGKALGAEPVVAVIGNRAVAFCCEGCPAKFESDVEANMAKLDAAIIAEVKPINEGGTCPISGKALGDKPVAKVYGTDVVAFCCEGCPKKFEANLSASMKEIRESAKS